MEALSVYDYDDTIKSLLFQFKGCYDYELKNVFISRLRLFLKTKFNDYYLLPAPSYYEDDELRGFNHVKEMFSCLGLEYIDLVIKIKRYKQSDHTGKDRENIKDVLRLNNNDNFNGKKILIVDDVFTTGSTIKSIIKLITPLHPKDIKVLVMSKTLPLNAPSSL